ncbi:hypothetical protein [Wolbachia sp. wLmal]|uniref:hypothetical protein n=1 Tax=Wolbachia sp. wLmal TaxID=3342489 RepID=UPI003C2EE585
MNIKVANLILKHNGFNVVALRLDSSVKHWNDAFVFDAKSAITFNALPSRQIFIQLCVVC